eukprot:1525165-Pyramimonas_sp.AAC.1
MLTNKSDPTAVVDCRRSEFREEDAKDRLPLMLANKSDPTAVVDYRRSDFREEDSKDRLPLILTNKSDPTAVVDCRRSDFREEDAKDYYGLAPGKTVMLRWAYPVKCVEVVKDASGE